MSKAWAYSANGLTTTITHTFDDPPEKPACASENAAPYTCTETQLVDLLGRTVETTDVWGTKTAVAYQLDPSSGVQTTAATTTAGAFTTTATRMSNRDGTLASQSRTDNAGSPTLETTWTYDQFGRTHTVETQSGGAEVITATYSYDDQNRVDSATWSRAGSTVVTNGLTLSPDSTRTLGETIEVNGVTYTFDYTFNNAGWLTEAELTSTDSLNAHWNYTFGPASLGSNQSAQLNGNVTTFTSTVGQDRESLELGYDFLDRVETTSPGTALSHDSLGNLAQFGDLELTYEQTSQLIGAKNGDTTVTFDRTPDGDVYRKTTANGTDTTIRYASNGLILDDSGTPTSQTVPMGPLLATLDLTTPGASDYTVTTLQYGNALLKLNSSGAPQNLAAPTLYSPWGEAINPPTADPSRPLFGWQATNLLETNLGLVQMGERVYLTSLGRFTSLDPVFGGGINGYNYADNDPVNNNDPNGQSSLTRGDVIQIYIAIGIGSSALGVTLGVSAAELGIGSSLFQPAQPAFGGWAAPENPNPIAGVNTRTFQIDQIPEDDPDLQIPQQLNNELNPLSEGDESLSIGEEILEDTGELIIEGAAF